MGNRFLSIFIRVFRAPDRASGQLLETVSDAYGHASCGNAYRGQEDEEDTPFLVEAQLREGDRLHFSALFPEILSAFKVDGVFCVVFFGQVVWRYIFLRCESDTVIFFGPKCSWFNQFSARCHPPKCIALPPPPEPGRHEYHWNVVLQAPPLP